MRPGYSFALVVGVFGTPLVMARGDGSLQAPLSIPAGRPGPVTVNWGDFNRDGKKDLVVANGVYSNVASGSPSILVLFQDPSARQNWRPLSLKVGTSSVYVRGADMTGDGFDDILVADVARSAWFVRNKGDGTFDRPVAIPNAQGARWIAVADFDHDGKLDFASANFTASNLTIFQGDGAGNFTLKKTFPGSREHTLEAIDYDGDGFVDLMLGIGIPGITPYKNLGSWRFVSRPNIANVGCIDYISEVAHYDKNGQYVLIGDFDKNGKGDLAVTCIDDGNAYAGVSIGNGTYKRTLQAAGGSSTEATAIADLNKDGNVDVAQVSAGSTNLWVHRGKGDGNFLPPIIFGPTGSAPVFLISQDLDMDGYFDVISAEQASFSVTVFWGKGGQRFLESGFAITGFAGAKGAMAVVDLDKDGVPDFLFPRSDQPVVNVYLKPGLAPATKPSRTIAVANKYSILDTADLDGDGISDLVGADPAGGLMLVALLDLEGTARNQVALDAGIAPSAVKVGQLDEGLTLDVAVPCKGSNHVAIFLGQGGGAFAEARILPTLEKPKAAALGKLDGDGWTDLAVISDNTVAVHFGTGGGDFSEKVQLVQDTSKLYTDAAIGDLNGDSLLDLVVSESKTERVLIFQGKGSREFVDPPVSMKTSGAPSGLQLTDLNGDGRLDITSSTKARSVSILLNQGEKGFSAPVGYGLGFSPVAHRIADLNQDGALDVVGHSATQAMILLGRPQAVQAPRFRRGDVSADGQIEVTDTILVLNRLFLGGDPLPCEVAGDADDDGTLSVTDTILILNRLFLGGEPLAPPGPESCGTDPTPDGLGCSSSCNG